MATQQDIERVVDALIEDLVDRSGLGDLWEEIDEEIQNEIRQDWIDLIHKTLEEQQ